MSEIHINLIPNNLVENFFGSPWVFVSVVVFIALLRFLAKIAPSISDYLIALRRKEVEIYRIDQQTKVASQVETKLDEGLLIQSQIDQDLFKRE